VKILVFGGSGFLGSYVVDELAARGHEVTIFDLKKSLYLTKKVTMIIGDIMDSEAVQSAVQGQEVIYNFAGLADLNDSIDKPVETVTMNVMGNLNILEAAKLLDVRRFIYASSVYVFSQKGAFYGASKKSSELIVEQYGAQYDIDYTIIRYGSVYGERADSNNRIYRIIREALTKKTITFKGNGSEEREFVHGRDAGKLSVDVLEHKKYKNQNVILTGIERFQYSQLLSFIQEMINDNIDIKMLNKDYKGHYNLTPYSFSPSVGVKLVNNPSVDFGQGLLECINKIFNELQEEGIVDALPVPSEYSE
jgi:UDP-glucose 4-epimerase